MVNLSPKTFYSMPLLSPIHFWLVRWNLLLVSLTLVNRGDRATKTFERADSEFLVVGKVHNISVQKGVILTVNRRGVRGIVIFDKCDNVYKNLIEIFRCFTFLMSRYGNIYFCFR